VDLGLAERLAELRAGGAATKEIARVLSAEFGLPSRDLYRLVLDSP
jgi:hypothetical protein